MAFDFIIAWDLLMPPSQLRKLKASLREKGITGSQTSKKKKRKAIQNGAFQEGRTQRNSALNGIREKFNPFDNRVPGRRSKHDVATNEASNAKLSKGSVARPGVTKGFGEENRRRTLLIEMQRRKKVGGILDRRFGENDPTMTPEEKALERFVKEKQRGSRKDDIFDLEDDGEDNSLTHLGQSLSFEKDNLQPSSQDDLGFSNNASGDFEESGRLTKRRKLSSEFSHGAGASATEQEMRPRYLKSKKETMEEIIAKSKLHKYERQQAKEDDDDLRAELDKGLPELLAFMNGTPRYLASHAVEVPHGNINPDRAALLNGKDRAQADKEYDEKLRQMAFDQRSKPSERTLTEEEKLDRQAQKLKELEEQRLRRMKGEEPSEDEVLSQDQSDSDANEKAKQHYGPFGLGSNLPLEQEDRPFDVEEEDVFIIEDDFMARESDADTSEDMSTMSPGNNEAAEEEREFVEALLPLGDANGRDLNYSKEDGTYPGNSKTGGLPYTFECPQTHEQLLIITRNISINDLPTVVQRIRALYHPSLHHENKAKLGTFSAALVDHISFLGSDKRETHFFVLESLIRHVHSLAKSFPEEVGRAFQSHLKSIHENRLLALTPGDLIILTAIGSIFPTSDHFHQVVTPAMLCIAAYLGQKLPRNLGDLATGTYLCTLCIQYQRLSKRYMPELVNYVLRGLWALAPAKLKQFAGPFPHGSVSESIRLGPVPCGSIRKLRFWDILHPEDASREASEELKLSLINTLVDMTSIMAGFWDGKPAFYEIFEPFATCLAHLGSKSCSGSIGRATKEHVQKTLEQVQKQMHHAYQSRKPLLLHNHRPRPIKTSIPKFEESYNPDKHYDPDRDRAEMSKLKAEHKKERKGAMRELRKDANFIARENLREKKEKDAQYEKKFKRLVAEIQGEEGKEAKNYEREKRMRKGRK